MKKLIIITIVCLLLHTQLFSENTLIIARGPVCCGMGNHLIHALKSLDSSYQIFSQNNMSRAITYKLLNELFPQQIAIITNAIDEENVCGALIYYHVYFKVTASEQQKNNALAAITDI